MHEFPIPSPEISWNFLYSTREGEGMGDFKRVLMQGH